MENNSKSMYDTIVIGGGIAGIHATYQISKNNPQAKVLLIEKENRWGGRIYTYRDEYMTVEAGAGRINGSHPRTMQLIRELGLAKKLRRINGSVVFRPADGSGDIQSSTSDAPKVVNLPESTPLSIRPVLDNALDVALGPKLLPNAGLVLHLVVSSKAYSKKYLQNHTLEQFAHQVLEPQQVQYIKRSFGYYSELVIMNAYDAIKLLNSLSPSNAFYSLEGGLDQIIHKMIERIEQNPNIVLRKRCEATRIVDLGAGFSVTINGKVETCVRCICALPKRALFKLAIFKPIRPLLDAVTCGTLCRIYSHFDKPDPKGKDQKGPDPKSKVWFHDVDKFTTDNDLRMVIPYNSKEGTIMISYSDNIFADRWLKTYERGGIRAVNDKLRLCIEDSMGAAVPRPKHTKVFYWDCGVGYWAVGADSRAVAEAIRQPFPGKNLFICGENYSEDGQQWMEGALSGEP